MNLRLDPAREAWMSAAPTRAVIQALNRDGGAARFVGGAVRDALIGRQVSDIDIATPLEPEQVIQRLRSAGLNAVPTGIAHGTVTAIAFGKPFEVTTLRRDVATDGRRAIVAYTTNWAEDAARRDFTINAIYAAEDGALFDPAGGIADLEAGRVRFIGDARQRIREDYLRILRFFRFHAWYAKGAPDRLALDAARHEKDGLAKLSGERVRKELLRLLAAKTCLPSLRAMQDAEILPAVLPEAKSLRRLERLTAIEDGEGIVADPILKLASLLNGRDDALRVAERLRLSNAEKERLADACGGDAIAESHDERAARALVYRFGNARASDRILLAWAADENPDPANWRARFSLARSWPRPAFPLHGQDVLAAGIAEGAEVGRILAKLEEWWIAEDFAPTREDLLAELKQRRG